MRLRAVKTLKDIYIKNRAAIKPAKKGIDFITDVRPDELGLGGTRCNESTQLKTFWKRFSLHEQEVLKRQGISTNVLREPRSFVKTSSEKPISTSGLCDCSALYLYNANTKTHAIYHAAPDVSKKELDTTIRDLMSEGVTHGVIIPGRSLFCDVHVYNMNNMLELLKKYNPDMKVNVKHSSDWVTEIVGYRGDVFENTFAQARSGNINFEFGEASLASFKVVDMQGYNTFDKILFDANNLKEAKELKQWFKKQNFPKESLDVFLQKLDERVKSLKEISKIKSLRELESYSKTCPEGFSTAIRHRKEELLGLEQTQKIPRGRLKCHLDEMNSPQAPPSSSKSVSKRLDKNC